jgi:hypothetical protein
MPTFMTFPPLPRSVVALKPPGNHVGAGSEGFKEAA